MACSHFVEDQRSAQYQTIEHLRGHRWIVPDGQQSYVQSSRPLGPVSESLPFGEVAQCQAKTVASRIFSLERFLDGRRRPPLLREDLCERKLRVSNSDVKRSKHPTKDRHARK